MHHRQKLRLTKLGLRTPSLQYCKTKFQKRKKTYICTSFCENEWFFTGKGQNYENQNVENQKEHRKPCKPSQRRKDLLKRSERRKGKRSEHRKEYQN